MTGPILDGDLVREAPWRVFARSEPIDVPLLVGANSNERPEPIHPALIRQREQLNAIATGKASTLAAVSAAAPEDEWQVFVAAVRQVAVDGLVHQCDMRPLLRGRVAPKHVGQLYRRARAEGLLRDTGDREPSNDVAGGNADKLDRIYALGAAA